MAHSIIMPKTGMAMEEGTVIRWLKKPGDRISKGEAIAVIETDKVTMDLESDYEGTLLAVVHGDGEVVKATHTIAWIGVPGEEVPTGPEKEPPHQMPAAGTHDTADGADAVAPAVSAPASAGPPADAAAGKPPATPAARAYAARTGIALSSVAGSGPGGAVRLRDFSPAQGDSLPLTGMRRAIVEKMLRSHQQVPSVTLITRADVTELVSLRARMNADGAEYRGAQSAEYRGAPKISYTDFVLRAVALALREHPLINSVIEADRILLLKEINIGIAVALEAGLIVPVVRRCGHARRPTDRGSRPGAGGPRAGRNARARRIPGRYVHDYQSRHVRDYGVHSSYQHPGKRDPRRGCDRGGLPDLREGRRHRVPSAHEPLPHARPPSHRWCAGRRFSRQDQDAARRLLLPRDLSYWYTLTQSIDMTWGKTVAASGYPGHKPPTARLKSM